MSKRAVLLVSQCRRVATNVYSIIESYTRGYAHAFGRDTSRYAHVFDQVER